MSTISAGTTTTTALVQTGDTTGSLVLQTGSTPTTAMTISSSQIVNFANTPTIGGSAFPSGAMTLISTQTANNTGTSLSWTGLNTYNSYYLTFTTLNAGSNVSIYVQTGYGSTPTWNTSNYKLVGWYLPNLGGSLVPITSASTNGIDLTLTTGQAFSLLSGNMFITDTTSTTNYAPIMGVSTWYSSSAGQVCSGNFNGYTSTTTNPTTAIRLITASGNMISGSASLYGISS
jgi:hypothetical protein